MKPKIVRREPTEDGGDLRGLPEFLARIYRARGVRSPEELELTLARLEDTSRLKGLDRAVQLLAEALKSQKSIMIVGDFDADGATSAALAVSALKAMGAHHVEFLVPNRFEYGYGLSPEIVDVAAQQGAELIVTVDNGISSIEGVNRAHELGLSVIVTDHHLPGDQLPEAEAIVNPNQPGCGFAGKNTAGVGVIFYVMSGLRRFLRDEDWFATQGLSEPSMAEFLDLVALGTVADLVPLDHNNRILVEQGLRRIRAGKARPGIRALLRVAGREEHNLVASDLGFAVAPRLNAAGRLDDMSVGIACLMSHTEQGAGSLAAQLDQFNQERKQIEDDMKREAMAQMDALTDMKDRGRYGVCLYQDEWHQGVIGILASRVKERFHRPAIVFAPENPAQIGPDDVIKGSARSISGLHIRDALDRVDKLHPGLLLKFGGHAMAAGMTIKRENYEKFSQAFNDVAAALLSEGDLNATLFSDGELAEHELQIETVNSLNRAGPWGQQFPEPAFDSIFRVAQSRVLKGRHLKLVLQPIDGVQLFDAIQFNSDWVEHPIPDRVHVLYRPSINEFRGRRSVQLMLDHVVAV